MSVVPYFGGEPTSAESPQDLDLKSRDRPRLPPRAATIPKPIFRPDLPAAENQAARDNIFRFFGILAEWTAAARKFQAHDEAGEVPRFKRIKAEEQFAKNFSTKRGGQA